MDATIIGLIGIGTLLILLYLKMPGGFAMAVSGFLGVSYIVNPGKGLNLLAHDLWDVFSSYSLIVLPLFVLMGQIAFRAGMGRRVYDSACAVVGRSRGGLATASVAACTGFSAVSGSANATAATVADAALPRMKKYRYDMGMATGTVASAGSLGAIIPPSLILIVYGILTGQPIGRLFVAGVLPGILLSFLFILTTFFRVAKKPPEPFPGHADGHLKKVKLLAGLAEPMILFAAVTGGIFFGIFKPAEAAAAGAFLTLIIAVLGKNLSWEAFVRSLADTTRISCMIAVMIAGAIIFGHFLEASGIPEGLATWAGHLPFPPLATMGSIILIYLLVGCFMDALTMIMWTIPISFPMALALGFDPIWFGVMIVLVGAASIVTPPVGINVFVVSGAIDEVGIKSIYRGARPMILALLLCHLGILIAPRIALFLPNLMR